MKNATNIETNNALNSPPLSGVNISRESVGKILPKFIVYPEYEYCLTVMACQGLLKIASN